MHAREIASRLRGLAEFFNRDQTLMVGTAQRMDRDGGRCRNYADEIGMSLNTNRITIRDLLKLAETIEGEAIVTSSPKVVRLDPNATLSEDESIVTHGLRRSEDPSPVEAGLERQRRQFAKLMGKVREHQAVLSVREIDPPAPDEAEVIGTQSEVLNIAEERGKVASIRYAGEGSYIFAPKPGFGRSMPDCVSKAFDKALGDGRGA